MPRQKKESSTELVTALVEAIKLTKPEEKKNAVNRPVKSPWSPKDGEKKLKLKRKMFQHGIIIDADFLDNETIDALNRLKPGRFLDGWVKVFKRRDSGIDIDYPIKTASQRMRLISQFGVRSLKDLCELCIHEAANPKREDTETE